MNNKGRCWCTVQGHCLIFKHWVFLFSFYYNNSVEEAMYVDICLMWIMSVLAARDETVILLKMILVHHIIFMLGSQGTKCICIWAFLFHPPVHVNVYFVLRTHYLLTHTFCIHPYTHALDMKITSFFSFLNDTHSFTICSLQTIWTLKSTKAGYLKVRFG